MAFNSARAHSGRDAGERVIYSVFPENGGEPEEFTLGDERRWVHVMLQLVLEIRLGILEPGDPIRATEEAAYHHTSYSTVYTALRELWNHGLIEKCKDCYFVSYDTKGSRASEPSGRRYTSVFDRERNFRGRAIRPRQGAQPR